MSWWESHVVPRMVDRALSTSQVRRERALVCAGLRGRVLEIGCGSGLNLPHLPPEVTALDAVEPSEAAWALSAPRRASATAPVERTGLDGQSIDAESGAYDAVLCTFTLCTIPDAALAAREMARLVRPGGAVHVLEHGLAPDRRVRRWQRWLDPWQTRLAGGCHLTRDPVALLESAGLEIIHVDSKYLPSPAVSRPWAYGYRVRAGRRA